jgi:hypothetical protein
MDMQLGGENKKCTQSLDVGNIFEVVIKRVKERLVGWGEILKRILKKWHLVLVLNLQISLLDSY